jgi:hypothetical protein
MKNFCSDPSSGLEPNFQIFIWIKSGMRPFFSQKFVWMAIWPPHLYSEVLLITGFETGVVKVETGFASFLDSKLDSK